MGAALSAAWQWVAAVFDLSLPDILSIGCALGFPVHRIWRHRSREFPRGELLIADLLRGAAFSTFVIVIMMAASRPFMTGAYEHNRVVLFISGVIGAAAVIKADKWLVEFFRDLGPEKQNDKKPDDDKK